ncbi:xanthine dehydrogenase accessory protein XdhC [Tropicimonas sp. TH_r6]|uniref:xanthine dehydrogenase accessory protein XdhC n=1 Tax=Tropicimonas sp. TH_r6 TaxID=3082085 RepID=UPI00295512CD|nr:xanthine dehydrogenase accessory protein XdhC [Tropicimonas sp. TH_r6]MDV7142326.1 xanthine dehydrogenase accessory protein XdhC [Tropicimonas sp. TH_r6]
MSFDLETLRKATTRHGRVARILVAEVKGSAPREPGASMLVWEGGQSGTIGGGRLEWDAAQDALTGPWLRKIPLGTALGQCCGGAVTLLCEIFEQDTLPAPEAGCIARPLPGHPAARPLSVTRHLAHHRNAAAPADLALSGGWITEPLSQPQQALWVWGAGHVGRAIVTMMAPLEDWRIHWIDTAPERFPTPLPPRAEQIVAQDPARLAAHAPQDAHHLILTYSHALDLALCHALLSRGFASAGLIGSATKWARFRKRLRQLGHSDRSIQHITCPIGDPSLGKAPQAIAVGVTALLLRADSARIETAMDRPA